MVKQKQNVAWIAGSSAVGVLLFAGLAGAAKTLLGEAFSPFFFWWLTLLLIGIGFYPLTARVFADFDDGGYLFSKTIGLAISGWLMWALSSVHLVKFTSNACLVLVLFCALLNYGVWFLAEKKRKKENRQKGAVSFSLSKLPHAVWLEVFFFAAFLLLTYLKCFKPEANGTEKFMDYGFMTSMMRADYMPPEDFWFSGTSLNYYYMGQYFATFLTKLSRTTANYGYNLALMMTAAFCLTFVYALVRQIFSVFLKERKPKGFFAPLAPALTHVAGFLSACAVTFAGSCHYLVFYKIVPILWDVLSLEGDAPGYWFPDATRYIGYHPETADKTIHEFPSYSFILGDLHAHVVNIMFVLTLLAVLFAWLLSRKKRMEEAKKGIYTGVDFKAEALHPAILLLGFFIGIFHMTNFWDFPIYYVVSGAVILASNAVVTGFKKQTVSLTALHAVVILGIAEVTAFLFTLRFDNMAGGVALCTTHTPLYQLFILWGFPVILVAVYLGQLVTEEKKRRAGAEVAERREKNAFFAFLENLKISDLFLIILGLCAAGLVLMPELVYVVDIYSGDYKRANTMFKLTYQAFILFGVVMGPFITRHVFLPKTAKQCIGGIAALYLLMLNTGYFFTSSETWFGVNGLKSVAQELLPIAGQNADGGEITTLKEQKFIGLDAGAFIDTLLPEDAKAIDWLNENVEGVAVVVEAPGDSYTSYERVSVLTGLPTIVGWHTHEWLWKGNLSEVDARVADVKTIYTCNNTSTAKKLLAAYEADYLYVGKLEAEKYKNLDYEWLKSLGEVVYEGKTIGRSYETFIVKLK